MKFSGGLTKRAKKERLEKWHDFFILWPRIIGIKDGKYECVCLETVERKGKYYDTCMNPHWAWEYKRKSK